MWLLLDAGNWPDAFTRKMLLLQAIRARSETSLQVLLENDATAGVLMNDLLSSALETWHEPTVRLLLCRCPGATEWQTGLGEAALLQAANYGHEEVVRLLLDKGVNLSTRSGRAIVAIIYLCYLPPDAGTTPQHLAT